VVGCRQCIVWFVVGVCGTMYFKCRDEEKSLKLCSSCCSRSLLSVGEKVRPLLSSSVSVGVR
jgi:hypothetical protein